MDESERIPRRRGPILWLAGFLKDDPAAGVLFAAMAIVLVPVFLGATILACVWAISQYLGQF